MHIMLLTRGIKHDTERFFNELSAKYLPFVYKGQNTMVQVAVRPYELHEVVFPREHLDLMCRTLFFGQYGKNGEGTQHKQHQKYVWALRKMLGIKKIPNFNKDGEVLPLWHGAVEKIGVGIKEDYDFDDGTEGL